MKSKRTQPPIAIARTLPESYRYNRFRELPVPGGRIDLLISTDVPKVGFVIVEFKANRADEMRSLRMTGSHVA